MKLATLKDSTRDGKLVVVSKDLTRCSEVGHIARTLQAALDDWAHVAPRLRRVAAGLETGSQPTLRFHEHDAASPLPRAYSYVSASDGSATLEYCPSGAFSGPRAPLSRADGDFEVRVAVVVNDVPMGADAETAGAAICLVLLANGDANRTSSFSPVAVSPESLGEAWSNGRLLLPVSVSVNGQVAAPFTAGADVDIDFSKLVVQAAKHRGLVAGTIVGSTVVARSSGAPVRVEAKDKSSHSIFGAIEQSAAGG